MIKYSIILCSYNRYELLDETITSVIRVLGSRNDYELLIIDNNSTDSTPLLEEKYISNSKIKYFLEQQQGLSHARNRGLKESKGDILVYLDDDIDLVDDYFQVCDEIFLDESISISGGKVLPYKVNIPNWLPKKYYFLVSVYDLGNLPKNVKYLMGGNFAIKKTVAIKVGTYNTALGRNGKKLAGGEEIDYQNRANEMGYKMFYHPNQNILHKINDKLNKSYVFNYAKELGKSERIIDKKVSKIRVFIKINKCVLAILLYNLFANKINKEIYNTYLKIIFQYSQGYLNIHDKKNSYE